LTATHEAAFAFSFLNLEDMPSILAWGERELLVAFTERVDLTMLLFLYDIFIAIECMENASQNQTISNKTIEL
jgi:hypothetical protein